MSAARHAANAMRAVQERQSVWVTCRELLKPTPEETERWDREQVANNARIQSEMDAAIARHRGPKEQTK